MKCRVDLGVNLVDESFLEVVNAIKRAMKELGKKATVRRREIDCPRATTGVVLMVCAE